MEGLELVAFKMITSVGTGKSLYIEAIQLAKVGDIAGARKMMEEGDKHFIEGHREHAKLIQSEATNQPIPINLLLVHAQDQLMSAETFKIIAREFIELYQKIDDL